MHTRTHTHTHVHTHTCTHVHTQKHIHIHTLSLTHTHTHIHTCTPVSFPLPTPLHPVSTFPAPASSAPWPRAPFRPEALICEPSTRSPGLLTRAIASRGRYDKGSEWAEVTCSTPCISRITSSRCASSSSRSCARPPCSLSPTPPSPPAALKHRQEAKDTECVQRLLERETGGIGRIKACTQ